MVHIQHVFTTFGDWLMFGFLMFGVRTFGVLCSGFLCSGFNPERPNSDVRGFRTLGVLMFGVQPRTSEYENPERPILNIENFGRSGFNPERPNLEVQRFRTFGVQPRTSEKGPPNVRTPNVRKWTLNPERPKMDPPMSEPLTSEIEPPTPNVAKLTLNVCVILEILFLNNNVHFAGFDLYLCAAPSSGKFYKGSVWVFCNCL